MPNQGTIYLLHFDRPYKHAQHYLGWTSDLDTRIATHTCGRGSPLIAAAAAVGIRFTLARTWQGDRHLERRLHNRSDSRKRLCPICQTERNQGISPTIPACTPTTDTRS